MIQCLVKGQKQGLNTKFFLSIWRIGLYIADARCSAVSKYSLFMEGTKDEASASCPDRTQGSR